MLRLFPRPRSFLRAFAVSVACIAAAVSFEAGAGPKTVCTVTINSPDERDTFKRHLPRGDYQFVELVQSGRPDWLAAACQRGVTCDTLVISGHFDDGTEFYTDRVDQREFLTVHELQQASCSASCSGLFAQLKDVYLFGCNTLKAEPRHVASAEVVRSLVRSGHTGADARRVASLLSERYGQSNRDRLRHVFKDVPVLYGFSSKAPLGRSAGPLLERYFQVAPAGEIGSGRTSATLLSLFGPSSMMAQAGLTDADPHVAFRGDVCNFASEDRTVAHKLGSLHDVLRRDVTEVRMVLDHLERYLASISPAQQRQPDVAAALAAIEGDHRTRDRYLEFARDTDDAAVQARMMALAHSLGWLSAQQEQAEFVRMIADRMAHNSLGKNEVDLVCETRKNADARLAPQLLATGAAQPGNVVHAAVLACLGNTTAHQRTVKALTGSDEDEVAIAQIYLRHRPLAEIAEVRAVASGIANMKPGSAQLRALHALTGHRLADVQSLREIAGLFPLARSLDTQRAIAALLVRADYRLLGPAELARLLRQHRLRSPDGGDVIDLLIRLLQAS